MESTFQPIVGQKPIVLSALTHLSMVYIRSDLRTIGIVSTPIKDTDNKKRTGTRTLQKVRALTRVLFENAVKRHIF